ncbi:MAG TPA: helix-turn-helix domain-containing protein [Steroidobacteraceae bacterium]|nr:helix-turn-helix domain-containing protein [Steroidobacteraceae bacterium]
MITTLMKRLYWFEDALQKALEPNGLRPLSRAQAFVVGNIAMGECKASNIARNLGVSRQAISQILLELERLRYIELVADPSDKRSRTVRFSAAFAEEGAACARIFESLEHELGRRIGQRRLAHLREGLEAEWGEAPQLGRVTDTAATGTRSKPKVELAWKRSATAEPGQSRRR